MAAVDIWYRARKLIERRLERGTYTIHFRGTYLIDDADGMIVVEVDSARVLSSLSRTYAPLILESLAEAGRPDTIVRLQTDLSSPSEEPDLLIRDLVPPSRAAVQPA